MYIGLIVVASVGWWVCSKFEVTGISLADIFIEWLFKSKLWVGLFALLNFNPVVYQVILPLRPTLSVVLAVALISSLLR